MTDVSGGYQRGRPSGTDRVVERPGKSGQNPGVELSTVIERNSVTDVFETIQIEIITLITFHTECNSRQRSVPMS